MFQIAGHTGEHLIPARDRSVQPAQRQGHIRVGTQSLGTDPVMAGMEFRMERGREGVLLPDGRHMARIHMLDIGTGHHVAGLHQERRVIRNRIVRVEAHHTACGVMEIFKEPQDRYIRPDLFHEQQLTPAGMAQDQVGPEALVRHCQVVQRY